MVDSTNKNVSNSPISIRSAYHVVAKFSDFKPMLHQRAFNTWNIEEME